jgi:hypothetical protein
MDRLTPPNEEESNLRFEYEMAQGMLTHYDNLNWQIGSILIAGVLVFTGLVINKDLFDVMGQHRALGVVLAVGIPLLSYTVLGIWRLWFQRHMHLYNLRNETLQRIELKLGMYHFLRVVEGDLDAKKYEGEDRPKLLAARSRAWQMKEGTQFEPFELYRINRLGGISGNKLAMILTLIIPSIQFLLLFGIWITVRLGS